MKNQMIQNPVEAIRKSADNALDMIEIVDDADALTICEEALSYISGIAEMMLEEGEEAGREFVEILEGMATMSPDELLQVVGSELKQLAIKEGEDNDLDGNDTNIGGTE